MPPTDPSEPLPTTPVGPPPAAGEPPRAAAPPPPPPASWGPPPGWGGGGPPWIPPPPPPRRDRVALAVVLFIFGGLFLVFFGFLLLAYSVVRGEAPSLSSGPRIGVVEVKGAIGTGAGGADSDSILKHLRKFSEDDGMKAVVVRIDSPGGAVGPSQELYDEIRRLAGKKVVVCSMGSVAASGGFYAAMGCDKIVAEAGTLTASIGVIMQVANVKGLVERWDIRFETVKSGKLKDTGNPFTELTPEKRAYLQALADEVYGQFLGAVIEARKVPEAKVREIADGRVITGAEAKERGLIDALGNLYDAVELAKTEAGLSGEPHLVYPADERARFLEQLMGSVVGATAGAIKAELRREAGADGQIGLYYLAD